MINWTRKSAACRTKQSLSAILNRMHSKLEYVARQWEDEDQYIVNLCDEAHDELEEHFKKLDEAISEAAIERTDADKKYLGWARGEGVGAP